MYGSIYFTSKCLHLTTRLLYFVAALHYNGQIPFTGGCIYSPVEHCI